MADDRNQQPYRGTEASQRPAASASANDPLAELARLIGQNDPFSEFGRDPTKRASAPRQPEAIPNWQPEPARVAPPAPQAPAYSAPDFTRQSFGGAPLTGGNDLYHVEGQTPGYPAAAQSVPGYGVPNNYDVPGYGAPGYEASGFPVAPANQAYDDDQFPAAAQHGATDDDYYDDVPPNRRRIGILAIAGIFALAVIGTAGAFGYRAVFGSSSSSSPPPVIKAEQAPSKIIPAATNKDAQSKITERASGPSERLVSREEQPVVVTTTMPPQSQSTGAPQLGTGVVGSEPKRIRTIAIKPDAGDAAMPTPPDSVPAPTAQPRVIATVPQRAAPAQPQAPAPTPAPAAAPTRLAAPAADPEPAPAPRAAPASRAEAPSANAPLSLNPNAAPARPAPPQRAAAIAPPPAAAASSNAGSGVYAVQVSAQRSEEEAQAAFRSLQGKFPGQLGNRQPLIKRVDLGEKGIFFRALVGPFTDSASASQMCTSLKSAGGSCLVQKN